LDETPLLDVVTLGTFEMKLHSTPKKEAKEAFIHLRIKEITS